MSMETWKPRRFVEEFQKRAGLLIDGIAGPQTQMALGLVPELPPGRIYPAIPEMPEHLRTTPTPIAPADIRAGDVVRVTQEFEVESRGPSGTLYGCGGEEFRPIAASQLTWHLIHRPDPDAEARACAWAEYRKDYAPNPPALGAAHRAFLAGWQAAREQGWDVVRRAES